MSLNRIPGKLKQFIQDLYSGKLHREFHFGPDPTTNEIAAQNVNNSYIYTYIYI